MTAFWWDDGGAQFGIVHASCGKREPPTPGHRIKLSLTCPLIVTGSALVLVDTGIGNRLSEREQAIYTPERGEGLRGNLRALGFAPEDVTHVILSHLHFDQWVA